MVQTAQYDPIVVEPQLTKEKIKELFGRHGESAKLDHKSEYDPSDTTHRVKLAKHVLAMANTAGGYIVVGVDDDGKRRGLDKPALERIDEATVRSQIAGYTTVPIPLFVTKPIEHEGLAFAIITVLPVVQTIVVATAEGNSPTKPLFRRGDVLVRHGSASERWTPADAEFMLQRIVNARKEGWLREFGHDLKRLVGLSGGSAREIDERAYELSAEDFQKLGIELLRKSNG
jgi:predicted HTH transcriptional regulator